MDAGGTFKAALIFLERFSGPALMWWENSLFQLIVMLLQSLAPPGDVLVSEGFDLKQGWSPGGSRSIKAPRNPTRRLDVRAHSAPRAFP